MNAKFVLLKYFVCNYLSTNMTRKYTVKFMLLNKFLRTVCINFNVYLHFVCKSNASYYNFVVWVKNAIRLLLQILDKYIYISFFYAYVNYSP